MFPMTITIHDITQFHQVMAAFMAGDAAKAAADESTTPGMKNRDVKPQSDGKAETGREETAAPLTQMSAADAENALQGHAERPPADPTYQDAAAALTKLAREKGRAAAVSVLNGFGATKLPEVKPEQFAAFIAACEKAGD